MIVAAAITTEVDHSGCLMTTTLLPPMWRVVLLERLDPKTVWRQEPLVADAEQHLSWAVEDASSLADSISSDGCLPPLLRRSVERRPLPQREWWQAGAGTRSRPRPRPAQPSDRAGGLLDAFPKRAKFGSPP